MKLLGLLLVAGLLTGCAAAENSDPIASNPKPTSRGRDRVAV